MAESLFLEARRLLEEGQIDAACAKFQASQDFDPQLGTLLNLGKCLEKTGRTASAWAVFTELARLAPRAGQRKRADYASERVTALASELSYLTLVVAEPVPGQQVKIDGRVIADAAYSTPLPLDPGERVIRAEADGYEPWSQPVKVEPGTRQSLVVPQLVPVAPEPIALPPPPPAVSPPPKPAPAPAKVAPPVVPPDDPAGFWTATVVAYTVAGAGLVVGSVTGILALKEGDHLKCPDGACPPSEADALSHANTLANVSNVAFVIGGVGVATGLVTMLLALDEDVAPGLAASRDGLLLRF